MKETIYDPLKRYRAEFRDKFLENAKAAFDELSAKAGIDRESNRCLCTEISLLSTDHSALESSKSNYSLLRILSWGAVVVLIMVGILAETSLPAYICFPIAGAILILIFAILNGKISDLADQIEDLSLQIQAKTKEAWEQMQPLNELFGWDIPAKLIEKTVPKLEFDPFFSESRLAELREDFGYDDSLNQNASVIFSQSGQINGNPFAVADLKTFRMGTKTYTGFKTIYWSETITGFDGKRQRITRSETLSASVTKPFPEFGGKAFVLYGNDAGPNLTFSRKPSKLTEDGFLQDFRRKRKLRSLKKFSQNLKDDSQYTLMGNHEFETLFETRDRNNEVEYRLLFTALAQKQMLDLIHDKTDGYGDDFTFVKDHKVNVIFPGHLESFDLDTNPERFKSYDYEQTKRDFIRITQEYFRTVYFAMAPLLTIPLYQQMRTRKEIYRSADRKSSFWEWEALANFYGIDRFKAKNCVTDCILKTRFRNQTADGKRHIEVTAHGFSGRARTDLVPVLGGDGRLHNVPVPWTEYNSVSKTSSLLIEELKSPEKSLTDPKSEAGKIYRRGIFSSLPRSAGNRSEVLGDRG